MGLRLCCCFYSIEDRLKKHHKAYEDHAFYCVGNGRPIWRRAKKELKDGADVIKITGPVRFDIFFRSEVK